jgi:FkbM family methyltransferase
MARYCVAVRCNVNTGYSVAVVLNFLCPDTEVNRISRISPIMQHRLHERATWFTYAVRNSLRKFGVDVGRAYPERSPSAFFMLRILPRTGVDLVLDVGARFGDYATELRHAGYKGLILSFEPIPQNFEVLKRASMNDSFWHAFPYAIGASDGVTVMNVTRHSAFNSILEPSEAGKVAFANDLEVVEKATVPVRRLDTVLPSILQELNCVDAKIFLKTDTQGYEMEVLRGARGLLENIPACRMEVAFKPSYSGAPTFIEMLEFMAGLGYDLSALFQVFYEGGLALAEGDAFFVRTVRGPSSSGHQSARSS